MADYNPNFNFMANMAPIPPPPPIIPAPGPAPNLPIPPSLLHPTYTHMHPPDFTPLDPIFRQTAQITSLQLQLHQSRKQNAESIQALQFLLRITSQQATQQPQPGTNDLELVELRQKYKQLELECQSLRDQICYLIQRAAERRRRRDEDEESVAYPESSDEEERGEWRGRSRGQGRNHGQLKNVNPHANANGVGDLVGGFFDNGFVRQKHPALATGFQHARVQVQNHAQAENLAHAQAQTANTTHAGPRTSMLQPSPIGKDGRDIMSVPVAAAIPAPNPVHVEQPALIDFDHHVHHVETASAFHPVPAEPATPTPIYREPEVHKLDTKAGVFVPAGNPTDVDARQEPKAEIHNPKQSIALASMEEGTKEWDDEDEKPKLPPLPVLKLDNAPYPVNGQAPRVSGLEKSRHNPSIPPRLNRDPIENFTSRPAHARDENWIVWKPTSQKWQTSHRVVVTNLPDNITPHTLLSQVCGGLVISCQLLDTAALTGTQSALIRFHDTDESCAFVKYARLNPIIFTDSLNSPMIARVSLIGSPSFPLTARRLDGIRRLGHTRCLMIRNFPLPVDTEEAVKDLRWFLRPYAQCKHDFVETIESRGEGAVYLAFVSIEAAIEAFGRFMANSLYRGILARFVEDPCNRPAKVLVAKEESERTQIEEAGQTEVQPAKEQATKQTEFSDKLNPDEIEIELQFEDDKDHDLDDESVALSISRVLMTPPDSSSEVGYDEKELAQREMGEAGKGSLRKSDFVPRRWDKAHEVELDLAILRGLPDSRE